MNRSAFAVFACGLLAALLLGGSCSRNSKHPRQIGKTAEIVKGVIWALAHLDEMGWGVALRENGLHVMFHAGTHWANPDDVLRAYQALLDRMLTGADIEADLAALAESTRIRRSDARTRLALAASR